MPTVRRAKVDDALVMGGVHVRAWQSAYRGQMPDEYLDGLSAQERAQMWSDTLARDDASRAILVVHDGEVVGFAAVGPAADAPSTGELYSINIEPDRLGSDRMSASSSQSWGGRDDALLSNDVLLSYYPDEGSKVGDLIPRTPYSSDGSRLQQCRERGCSE